MYEKRASKLNPGLVIFLLDVSASMENIAFSKKRIDLSKEIVSQLLTYMVMLSLTSQQIKDRYRIAFITYGDTIKDIFGGIKTLNEIANSENLLNIRTEYFSDISSGFEKVENILLYETRNYSPDSPAPLIIHISDGGFVEEEVTPIVQRIMQLSVPDGKVLVESIVLSDQKDIEKKFYSISSEMPEYYKKQIESKTSHSIDILSKMIFFDSNLVKYCLPLSEVSR